ncbi:sensor histidine kinase [Dokdonia sp. Hel_I_53]|uniref:sensor histidine kinase n=1 Tax=Dokdonia sp. Hel_I_53 TaxID=1566287 RepID=UPI001198DDF0|nr:ATP-binding protein [Dokdonia sp. Hel_I_53]TVZ53021.1 histidine kinase [Dokdonia sp. Hel_I_53]
MISSQNQDNGTLFIVLVAITILLLLLVIVIVLFSVFMKRKNTLLIEKEQAKKRFEKEIAETQIEIREETLRNISWELHDNIGQLLTLAKIQTQNCGGSQKDLNEAAATIGKGLTEIRALSKLINPEALKNMSLPEAIDLELERFNRMAYLIPTLEISGTPITIDKKIQIIIFRILQELFTNTIKHSKATNLDVLIVYKNDTLHVIIKDNGVGFDYEAARAKNGIGLTNIETRVKLIGANIEYNSQLGEGTIINLTYKPQTV